MRRPGDIQREAAAVGTLAEITSIFEGIASLRIAKIKDQVMQATKFFHELWHIYSQLRVDSEFRYGRAGARQTLDKELYVIITAEGGFSGDIDAKLIDLMLKTYDPAKNDVVVVGHHGAVQLAQRGVPFRRYFKLPKRDQNFNVGPIVRLVQQYRATTVFFQEYVSLMIQDVRRIELHAVVEEQAKSADAAGEIISEKNYLFEPSVFAVVDHLERSMLHIALSQLILDSKLAQYASRFRAMTKARQKADDARHDLRLEYSLACRAIKDERLKELINGLRKAKARL